MRRASCFAVCGGLVILAAVFTMLALGGCASVGAGLDYTKSKSIEAIKLQERIDDAFLEAAELSVCQAATKGALDRRYGKDGDVAKAYNEFCSRTAAGRSKLVPISGQGEQ